MCVCEYAEMNLWDECVGWEKERHGWDEGRNVMRDMIERRLREICIYVHVSVYTSAV